MLGFTFPCKFDWDFDITLTVKAATHKIGALIHSMKLLYGYKLRYGHAWNTAVMSGLLLQAASWKC